MELTERQAAVLEWVRSFIKENGHSPTQLQIAVAFGVSAVRIHEILHALEKLGALRITGRKLIQIGDETPLTEIQRKVLNLFKTPVASQRAIADKLGIKPPSLSEHVRNLQALGALEVSNGKVTVKIA